MSRNDGTALKISASSAISLTHAREGFGGVKMRQEGFGGVKLSLEGFGGI